MNSTPSVPARAVLEVLNAIDEHIHAAVSECIERLGFEMPLILVIVGRNGSVLATRLDKENKLLCEHSEGAGLTLPINIMITDAKGEGARTLIPRGARIIAN